VLYETLAGEPPFVRESPVSTAMAHIRDVARPVREVRPETPPELAGIVHACLAKDPELRPSAGALGAALQPNVPVALGVGRPEPDSSNAKATSDHTEVLPLGTAGAQRSERTAQLEHVGAEEHTPPFAIGKHDRVSRTASAGRRPSRRAWWVIAAIALALVLTVVGVVTSGGAAPVKVPRFVGLREVVAVQRAERLGLVPVIQRSHGDVTAGTVFGQRPGRGMILATGSPIVLSVSLGPFQLPVTPSPGPSPKGGDHGPPGHDHHGKGND
jgi:serine/threonine-protein kinase